MALLSSPEVYGYTLFCDDIRQEADGKFIYIGVYGSDMFVHGTFPFTLPKFCFGITLIQKKEKLIANIELQVFLPGDADDTPSIKANLSEQTEGIVGAELDALTNAFHPATRRPDDEKMVTLHANMIFTSLIIKEPGQIRVRAVRGDDIVRLGGLRVSPAPQTSSQT